MRAQKVFYISAVVLSFTASFLFTIKHPTPVDHDSNEERSGDAWGAFQWWYAQRALPYDSIPQGAFQKAVSYAKTKMKKESPYSKTAGSPPPWVSLGPNNVGGRVLSLAVNPNSPNIVWAGSASGGLWKSTTGGAGANAWSLINTGYNTLSVSTIALNPANPNIMYIGTGEISLYHRPLDGVQGARSSYGMGVLKSTDGGNSWAQTSLTFTFSQIIAVEKVLINPLNPNTIFAATSEGTYRSQNAGSTWTQVNSVLMAMDVVINPVDTTILFASHGSYNSSSNPGLYKSTNGGTAWTQLTNGLPSSNFGRTSLAISPTTPSVVYAGIANGSSQTIVGLYKTTDNGLSWSGVSNINYVGSQGWYANVVAVHPTIPDTVYCAGLDIYKSTNGGSSLISKSDWTAGYTGTIPPGGAEGTSSYVHADHHAIALDPTNPRVMYFGCDGGVFKSTNGGESFFGCNGGFVTTQFYPNFANSFNDTTIGLGGLQDNGALKYIGSASWSKVDVGDAGWSAINPLNNNIMYDEYLYLTLKKTTTGGTGFSSITNGLPTGSGVANFLAPFVLSPSSPNILYAGNLNVYKTTDEGNSWFAPNGGSNLNGTPVACIGVSWTSPDTLIAATGTGALGVIPNFSVYRSINGGQTWTNVTGSLPNRYPTDIEFDPTNSSIAYLTYSGYGTPHVFKTTNVGLTWTDITSNLPDIPHQSVTVDPFFPDNIFVGTDLGVFHSSDAGGSWEDFNNGMPPAMILDLSFSRNNKALRAATFGNGVYQRILNWSPTLTVISPNGGEVVVAGHHVNIQWNQSFLRYVKIEYSKDNGATWTLIADSVNAFSSSYLWTVPSVSTSQGRIRIKDAISGIAADSSNGTFTILVNPDIDKGWNLISVDVYPFDSLKSSLFPTSISSAYGFANGYIQRDTLITGTGYWLKFGAPQNITLSGDSVFADTFHVKKGWNLIGSLSHYVPIANITPVPPLTVKSDYWGYQSGYITATSLRPKRGYWVNVDSDGDLVLNSSSATAKRASATEALLSKMDALTFSDNNGNRQTLYFGKGTPYPPVNAFLEMPPLPPVGIFDIRFTSQRVAEFIPSEIAGVMRFAISIQSATYPVDINWNTINDENLSVQLQIDGTTLQLTANEHVNINNSAEGTIVLNIGKKSTAAIPSSFILNQNYPNPFNPTTMIRYYVPADTKVTLKVYDILGKEIGTLVDEVQSAGLKSEEWNGEKNASGIYFYKLTAGSFSEVKKMVLVK